VVYCGENGGYSAARESQMTTKEKVLSVVDQMTDEFSEEEWEALYRLLQQYVTDLQKRPASFLERLSEIEIEGPEDFAENIDQYLNGEKQLDAALY
jgi:hypothetical protein